MKFEEFLTQPREGQRRRRLALHLQEDPYLRTQVGELRDRVLRRAAMKPPGASWPPAADLHLLLAELDAVEEEIALLERSLHIMRPQQPAGHATLPEHPNRISEQLLSSLVAFFVKMSPDTGATKHTHSRARFPAKSSFTCKARPSINHHPCHWDALASKGYAHITRTSFTRGISDCHTIMPTISALLKKLCDVDLAFLKYKQKLAFWINVYNACIMNAYLQHGLPSTQEKMLSLMNKAAINVGGIVLNALAIEHYILRHPHDSKQDVEDEKETLLRRAYGLRYPEPNVTFALCRGNWSSPALRVYSAEDVVNELERAKVEYLEAWVGVRSKKKIVVPKLVRWHMRDFADDLESLIEWIYSQLPHNGSLKRRIMECLNSQVNPMVEILPYQYDFRYLIIPTLLHKGYE